MKHDIVFKEIKTPVKQINLTLTPREFVVLDNLAYKYLGGASTERSAVEKTFGAVRKELGYTGADLQKLSKVTNDAAQAGEVILRGDR